MEIEYYVHINRAAKGLNEIITEGLGEPVGQTLLTDYIGGVFLVGGRENLWKYF